jgi:hypothetical protein
MRANEIFDPCFTDNERQSFQFIRRKYNSNPTYSFRQRGRFQNILRFEVH